MGLVLLFIYICEHLQADPPQAGRRFERSDLGQRR